MKFRKPIILKCATTRNIIAKFDDELDAVYLHRAARKIERRLGVKLSYCGYDTARKMTILWSGPCNIRYASSDGIMLQPVPKGKAMALLHAMAARVGHGPINRLRPGWVAKLKKQVYIPPVLLRYALGQWSEVPSFQPKLP